MKIAIYLDDYEPLFMPECTADNDYERIVRELNEAIPGKHKFKRYDVNQLHELGSGYDICVVDFGGIGSQPGRDSWAYDLVRQFQKQAEDKPSTYFLLWSSFCSRWYNDLIRDELGEAIPANVRLYPKIGHDDEWETTLKLLGGGNG